MWRKGKRRRGRAGSAPRTVFHSEALETRRLFGGHTVNGTEGNDTIVVNFVEARDGFIVNEYRVTVNGQLQTFRAITAQIRGLDGNDTISVNNMRPSASLEVLDNSGDDTITVGGGNVERNLSFLHV